MNFDRYLSASFQKEANSLRVIPRGNSHATSGIVTKTTPDFNSLEEQKQTSSTLQSVPIRGINRLISRRKKTGLDGLAVNLKAVRGEAHWNVPSQAGTFYLEVYFVLASKTQITLYQAESKAQSVLLKLEEERALVGIEIKKNPPIETAFTIYVNGIKQENVLKFAPQECEIIIKAKKGFAYANPFILQPAIFPVPTSVIPSFASSHLSTLLRRTDSQCIVFNKSELPADKEPANALIDKYMLTNGTVNTSWINKTELLVTLSHKEDYNALKKTNGAKGYPLINDNASVVLERFLESDESRLLSGFSTHFSTIFPSLSDNSGDQATELIGKCAERIEALSPNPNPSSEAQNVEFFPIADQALPSLVIKKGVLAKSVPMRSDGTYDLEGLHFGEPPRSLDDRIKLHLELDSLKKWFPVFQRLLWMKVKSRNILGALLIPFLQKLAQVDSYKHIYMPVKYRDAMLFFQTLLSLLQRELCHISTVESHIYSKVNEDQEKLNAASQLPFFQQPLPGEEGTAPPSESVRTSFTPRDFTFYEVIECTRLVAEIQDQLYALSQSAGVGDDIKEAWGSALRLHTAFGRLSSFTSAGDHIKRIGSTHSSYALAEAGLVAVRNEHTTSYRLWNCTSAFVPLSDLNGSASVPEAIKRSYSHLYESVVSRLHIPLSHTAKYLPPVSLAKSAEDIHIIRTAPNLPFLLVGYADMSVAVINGKLRLMPLFQLSLKTGTGKKGGKKDADQEESESKPQRSKSERKLDYGSEEDDDENEGVGDLLPQDEDDKPEEKPFEVNKDMLNNMVSMGFDQTLSAEALKKCNNQSIEAAIDAVIEIQNSIEQKFKTLTHPSEAPPPPAEEPTPKLSEHETKRLAALEKGRLVALDLLPVSMYVENTIVKYKFQAVVKTEDSVLVFHNSLQYHPKVIQSIGELHKDEALNRVIEDPEPRYDLETILPLYEDSLETLVPLFSKIPKPLFDLRQPFTAENNFCLIENVGNFRASVLTSEAHLLVINQGKEVVANLQGDPIRLPLPDNLIIGGATKTHIAGLFSGDIALFSLQNLKEPLAVFPLQGEEILTDIDIKPTDNNFILKFESAKGNRTLLAQKVEDMFSITEEGKVEQEEESKESDALHLSQEEHTVQAGLQALETVEVTAQEMSPYIGDLRKKTIHFKRPIRLSGVEAVIAFESKDVKGEHVTRQIESSHKYQEQILALYPPVIQNSDHPLALKLVSMNGTNVQQNTSSVLSYPKIASHAESGELESNPYYNESDKDFLFEHFDGHRMLVSMLKFYQMFEWSNTTLLVYTGDSIAQIYEPTPDNPDIISQAHSLLQNFKSTGVGPLPNQPVAVIRLTKSEGTEPSDLKFPLQIKRPARYLRVRVVEKNSKQGSRFLTNTFEAYGSETEYYEVGMKNAAEFVPSRQKLNVQLTLKREGPQGVMYEEVKLEPESVNISEVVTPNRVRNEPISKLLQAFDSGTPFEGKIVSLARVSIPLKHSNVIGVRAWLESEVGEEELKESDNCFTPFEIKLTPLKPRIEQLSSLREEVLFGNLEDLIEACLAQRNGGLLLLLKTIRERPNLLSQIKPLINPEQIIVKNIFRLSHSTADLWIALELLSHLCDYASLKDICTKIAKQALKLQSYITEELSSAGVHFMLTLFRMHLHQAHNLEYLDILQAVNSLIFTKFSAKNPDALSAFKKVWEHLPLESRPKVMHCVVNSKLSLAEGYLTIELQQPSYVEDVVLFFAQGDKSSSHFPDSANISASLSIDGDDTKKIAMRHFVGVCDSYVLKVGAKVNRKMTVFHVTYPQHPTIELQGIRATVFGFSKVHQHAESVSRYRYQGKDIPAITLTPPEQAAVATLPRSPKTMQELGEILEQARSVADYVSTTIEESIGNSSMELTQKHAEKCFSLWLQLPGKFHWPAIEQKIQQICKTVFSKVAPAEAANVSLSQLRSVLIKGKSSISHKALLRLIESLQFQSNFIYAYMERYINSTPLSYTIVTNTQLNTSIYKQEMNHNFLFLYSLVYLGEKLPYLTDKNNAIFQQQGRLKLCQFSDISLPFLRPQKNKIIANTIRCVLELRSTNLSQKELTALLRLLLLSLISGMKSEMTEAAKYLYGDQGRGEMSLMVRLLQFTLKTGDPELKMLMHNLCCQTKGNSNLQGHVDGPVYVLNKLKAVQSIPRTNVSEWLAKVRYLMNLIQWKSSSKVIDYIYSLSKLTVMSPSLQKSHEFWSLMVELVFHTRSHIAQHLASAITFVEQFFIHAAELKTEYSKMAGIITTILVDQKRDQSSSKSKLARLVFRSLFKMLEDSSTNQDCLAVAGFTRQIFVSLNIPLPQERAVVLYYLVTKLLTHITKWNLDDPACANSLNSIYTSLAYQILQKLFFQKDPEQSSQICSTVLSENEVEELAHGLVKWFFLTQELKEGKEPNAQEHQVRIITDGLYRLYITLCHSQLFRRKAMQAVLDAIKVIDTTVIDQEIAVLPAVQLSDHACSIFGGLLRLTIGNRQDMLYFMQDIKGYQFLEERLGKGAGGVLYGAHPQEEEVKVPITPLVKSTTTGTKGHEKSKTIEKMPSTPVLKTKRPDIKAKSGPRKEKTEKEKSAKESEKTSEKGHDKSSDKIEKAGDKGHEKGQEKSAGDKAHAEKVEEKKQSSESDLFEDDIMISVKNSGQYLNLNYLQIGETVDKCKPFQIGDIKVENIANRKLTKIDQRSSSKYNKDFNWTGDGWQKEGTHTGLAVSYHNERSLSFSLQTTIELTSIMVGFPGILSSTGTNRPLPPAVTMNFGLTEDMRHSIRLQRLEELHFGSSVVYGANLQSISSSKSLSRAMDGFRRLRARFINFNVERGFYFGLRQFAQQKQLTQNSNETLKFLEINGYPIVGVGNHQAHIEKERQTSTLSFIAELVKDKRLKAAQALSDLVSGLHKEMLQQFVVRNTTTAIQFLLALVQDAPDQTGDDVLQLVRDLILSENNIACRELQNFAVKVALNLGSELRPELQAVIQKVRPFITAVIKNIHNPDKRAKIELLSKMASSILLMASKEHTFSSLPEPLQLHGAPSLQDIFTLARHVESSQELMELFTIFLNPPLGLRITSFKQTDLSSMCVEHQEDTESRVALIRSLISASDGAQAIQDFSASQSTLLGNIDELLANKASQDTLLISKLHEWTERDQIRRKLVKDKAGIALYEILKRNYGQNEEREEVVNKVVQCIKRLVYGFPAAQEELAQMMLQDDKLFQESNKQFNKHVLFPLLFGEETVSLTVNPFFATAGRHTFLSLPDEAPIPLSTYAKSLAQDGFPFITSILQPEQKRIFSEFLGSNLTTAQLLSMQFFKTGSEYSLSENNFSTNSALIAFGAMFQKQQNITYTCGLVSTTSVEGIMNAKISPSSQTYLLIYTDEPRYIHIRLKPSQKKSLFFKLEKKHYFPSKENYIFKLEPGSHSSSDPLMLSFSPRKPNIKEECFSPIEADEFKNLKWPGEGISIPLKISSASIQSLLQMQNAISKIKSYQFANPFFERATQPLDHFSFMEKAAVTGNPWYDVHNDFVARLNPKWRIPKGASLRYVIEQLFSVKYPSRPQNSLSLFLHGRSVDPKATLGEVLSLFNELKSELHPEQELKEEVKEHREGVSLGGTIELELDVSNLLKIYYSELPSGSTGTTVKKVYKKWASKKPSLSVGSKKEEAPKQTIEPAVEYIPEMGLFQCFSKAAGFNKIVQLLRQKLSGADPKKVEEVTCWLEEIENFSQFPSFETLLLKNKDCRDFFLEDVMRSDNIVEKFMARKDAIGNVPFETLSSLFTSTPDPGLRQMALEKNILKSVLKNVEILTKEKPRRYDAEYDAEEEEKKQQEKHEAAMKEAERKKKEEEAKKNIEKVKRKGVGYVTNEGQVWNIQKYMNDREARNERVASFLNLIASLFDSEDWSPESHHVTPLLESCLLPLMESTFSAGSLVNLVKDYPLVMAQFHMVCVFARHRQTSKLLLKLDPKYVPQQMISINELLSKLKDLSDIFLGCLGQQQQNMKASDSVAENKAEELARAIQDTGRTVERALARFGLAGDQSAKLFDALSLPLPKAYIALLKDMRFDYMELDKKDGKFVHFYESNASQELVSPPSKMVRLAQELADLSTALPIDHTNAIFVRVDRERIDLMKAIIFGANGTPYAHGAFEYDLYLPQKYPDVSPKCNLTTTGGGQVRFNPNLYSSGKVCLSLLGTWRGNANENWDPKVSTILQVLLSIQAVVMSEEVYFNEPGYENTAGTPDGERKNEGYSNIVKYANIKFAMVEAIRKPPKGFETVVRRHFYLKRDQIMKEVKTWIPMAEKNEANYTGLVSSHNWKWCELFKKEKLSYKEHLVQVIEELEKELYKLEPPSIRELGRAGEDKSGGKKKAKEEKVDLKAEAELLDNIDVADEDEATQQAAAKEMDISDQKVKDRWSRYIGAMGVDAVAKQAAARVLVSGAGAVGIEIAKNMVLAGCKVFTLHDVKPARWTDLSGQFFLANKDIGRNRAVASVQKLQQLNYYVKVGVLSEEIDEDTIKAHDVVILTDPDSVEQIIEINRWCRKHKVKFLLAESVGLFGRMFADFGEKFPVLDKNGEELQDVMINEIKTTEVEEKKTVVGEDGKETEEKVQITKALVEVLTGTRHNYEDGDEVEIREVQGMKLKSDAKKSINGEVFKVTVISPEKFILEGLELGNYTEYEQNGICKQLKQKIEIDFKTFEEAVLTKEPAYDMNLYISDFEKMSHWPLEHAGMMALTRWKAEQGGGLPPQSLDDVKSYLDLANEMVAESDIDCDPDKQNEVLTALALTSRGVFNPLCAFMGGVAAQECVKAITNKFSPLKQLLYFDSIELLPQYKEEKTPPVPEAAPKSEKKESVSTEAKIVIENPTVSIAQSTQLLAKKEKVLAQQQDDMLKLQGMQAQLALEAELLKTEVQVKLMALQTEIKAKEEQKKEEADNQENPQPKEEEQKTEEEQKKENEEEAKKQDKPKDYLSFWTEKERLPFKHQYENTRNAGLANSVGVSLTQGLSKVKLFMVGAGAIGCELLKNYAMLNLGTTDDGLIVLTDPDHIEVSNLNRQFLFREKHLRKPKASTAAAAAIAMNPYLKGRIYARLDKVFPGTEHIFTDKFFTELSVVTNALDNIQARRYVDQRCVTARTPLLESGTLGPKGHIQVVLPGKTESYGSQADPENTNEIPHCTLKMFPEETLHCVEWARDLFGKLFTQNPQNLTRVLDPDFIANGPKDSADLSALRKAVKMLRKRPTAWEQCVEMARAKFQKHFINDIKQLLHVYPLDKKTKQGKPFWASPKRPPHETPFDEKNELHIAFIVAFASLTARIYGIEAPKNVRSSAPEKEKVAGIALKAKVPEFKIDQKKLESIAKEVESEKKEKEESKEESKGEEEEEEKSAAMENVPELMKELQELQKNLPQGFASKAEQFEKDDDENGHIDFIHSLANCRSANYKLEPMSWINVKLKAGRIVPALATTTAAVSGLQTLELVKLVKGCTLEQHRNVFLNLALPSMTASEPGEAEVTELREGLKVTLWDRWEVKGKNTLGELMQYLEEEYKLKPQDVMRGNKALYMAAIMAGKEEERKKLFEKSIKELSGEDEEPYVDLTVTFTAEGTVLKGVPPVRFYF